MASSLAFDITLLFWRVVINIFFREIRPRGSYNIPKEGAVIFVAAPHHNQFLDPLLLASEVRREAGRRVAFLIASKSMNRRWIGMAARLMQSIPVARAADDAKPGIGTLTVDKNDPLLLHGHRTQFTKQLVPRGQVVLPKSAEYASAEVVEVLSDDLVRIKKEFKNDRAREILKEGSGKDGMGCEWKVLPYIDQTEMYAHVYARLKQGGCLGIFPEGGSHDRTDLLPLKAGVTIMALGAMHANPNLRVRIVPVGLSYFHPHKFRSRAVVEFGQPVDVPRDLVELFGAGGPKKREACGRMMDMIFDGLKSVTVRAPDYETLMVIQAGRRMYRAPGQHLTLGQVVELNKRFIAGYLKYQDEPRVQALKAKILRYNKMLRYLGLRDHQVERATRASWRSLGLLGYRLGLLGFWGLLALPGVILNSPIFILAKIISRRKAKEALAASQVKLEGRDVVGTWKVLVTLGVAPFLYAFYAIAAAYYAHRKGWPRKQQYLAPIWAMIVLPTMSYSALKFGEVGIDVYKSLRPLFISLLPGNEKALRELQATRTEVSNELNDLIEEYGPRMYQDFEESRVLPASTPPPSAEPEHRPMLWRRKSNQSSNGQGDMLTHPMAWLDDTFFGWSKGRRASSSYARYKSIRESLASTPRDTPEQSDVDSEEEDGDYEAVFGMVDYAQSRAEGDMAAGGRKTSRKPRSRTRSGSSTFAEKRNRSFTDVKGMTPVRLPSNPSSPVARYVILPTGEQGTTARAEDASGLTNRGSRTSNANSEEEERRPKSETMGAAARADTTPSVELTSASPLGLSLEKLGVGETEHREESGEKAEV